jgi:hypothetical protein
VVNVGERDCDNDGVKLDVNEPLGDCDSEGVKLDVCEVLRVVVNDAVAQTVCVNDTETVRLAVLELEKDALPL